MRELTDEQYEDIWLAGKEPPSCSEGERMRRIKIGRAAYAASFPHAVAEALQDPSERELIATAIDAQTNWSFEPGCDYDRARRIFANRLARLTAKPDAAVDAVKEILAEGFNRDTSGFEAAVKIVAAVDAARAKEAK